MISKNKIGLAFSMVAISLSAAPSLAQIYAPYSSPDGTTEYEILSEAPLYSSPEDTTGNNAVPEAPLYSTDDLTQYMTPPDNPAYANLEGDQCGFDAGVWVCSRKTKLGIGNHAYLWDGQTQEACGMAGLYGPERGLNGDDCNFIPGSEGREYDLMKYCRDHANDGMWFPGVNDCHNATEETVESNGLEYPEAPGGRLGSPYDEDSWTGERLPGYYPEPEFFNFEFDDSMFEFRYR
jgi:hypothetical protein